MLPFINYRSLFDKIVKLKITDISYEFSYFSNKKLYEQNIHRQDIQMLLTLEAEEPEIIKFKTFYSAK